MNKDEKKLANKVLETYKSPTNNPSDYSRTENIILEHWRALSILNKDAFIDVTSLNSKNKEFLQNQNYPFTNFGDEEISKNWYMQFRDSKGIIIIRDLFTVIAFFVSLYVAIFNAR